ncbi:MAG: N-acetylmuramic acid 6-phosphate etherase [Rhodobacteraceae bacterium]|nr:N-acetylmuramic acid 6-phosphate etherase [Paracoccaceae bacterium]
MSQRKTEARHQSAAGIDAREDSDVLAILLEGQARAVASVEGALPQIGAGAALMAHAIANGGRLVYAASGSSGLMALADAAELGGTYGIPAEQISILMSGGLPVDARMPGDTEDDTGQAHTACETISGGDVVIALSASGTTPYPMTIARIARDRGARVIAIANNPGAEIFTHADVAICAPTPPELVAGSTRMGAGTAQKAVLNMMSTLMGIRLGGVFDGMMVNLVADNTKLRRRAAATVATIAKVNEQTTQDCLTRADGAVKPAVLLAAGLTVEQANDLLTETNGNLRACLARL